MDLKKTLNFESLLDELNQRNLLSEQDCKDYVFNIPGTHFKCAKIIKLMIKRRWCKDFVAYLHETPRHKDIWKKIKEIKDQLSVPTGNVLKDKTMHVEHTMDLNLRRSNILALKTPVRWKIPCLPLSSPEFSLSSPVYNPSTPCDPMSYPVLIPYVPL